MSVGGYSAVAGEYYDAALHPTCANFGELSRRYIERRIDRLLARTRTILEVGAGRSVVAKILKEHRSKVELTLLDSSSEMLSASQDWAKSSNFVVADAQSTGLPQGYFDLVISSLGDPYNTFEFWREISRLLQPNGICLFTTPAPEWARSFRDMSNLKEAEFILSTGATVRVPSFVPSHEEQLALVESAGLKVESVEVFSVSDLTGRVSPKLECNLDSESPIVLRGFEIRKVIEARSSGHDG
jgi:ubiquinone/menaquinone biosynthesis C-methylase UbiE